MSGWIGPAISAATSLYGAYTANQAANRQAAAARQAQTAQQGATDQQLNLLSQMYNQNRTDLGPYRAAGQQGLEMYAGQVAQPFQTTPGYQFNFDQAMQGAQQSGAARGMLNSGSTLRALQDRASGLAGQEYGNYMNRLASLAGIGQTSAAQGGQMSAQYGGQASGVIGQGVGAQNQYLTAGAGAQASGMTQGANALMGGANSLLDFYMRSQKPGGTP